jgi:fructokinase
MVTLVTGSADETLPAVHQIIRDWHDARPVDAIGIASFGPIQLNPLAADFGAMLRTPKPGWSAAPIAAPLVRDLPVPWQLDTDVNAAALAEYRWGAGQGCHILCYITVGTGVGAGVLFAGRPLHGAMHPEVGHLRLRRSPGDSFTGHCRFHGDCVEGLVGGPALTARFGDDSQKIADNDPRWGDVAWDLAELCGAILLSCSPERILLGGGIILKRPFLLAMIRERLVNRLSGYLPFLTNISAERIIAPAGIGECAGPAGALALAQDALVSSRRG